MKKLFIVLPLVLVLCFIVNYQHAEDVAEELHNSQAVTKKVDVGGYNLYLKVMGEGSPVVVMDSGLGEASQAWAKIQPKVAGFAQAVSYDRAGLGQSESGPEPRTPKQVAIELEKLLKKAEILPPYVLVGSSLGGIHILTFASLFPNDVAGLVFVDAKDGTSFDAWRDDLGQEKYDELFTGYDTYMSQASGTIKAEWESLKNSIGKPEKLEGLPDVPVIVLSSIRLSDAEKQWGITQEVIQSSLGVHKRLVEQFPQGTLITTEKSGHRIHDEEPVLVIDSIRKIVNTVRKNN